MTNYLPETGEVGYLQVMQLHSVNKIKEEMQVA